MFLLYLSNAGYYAAKEFNSLTEAREYAEGCHMDITILLQVDGGSAIVGHLSPVYGWRPYLG